MEVGGAVPGCSPVIPFRFGRRFPTTMPAYYPAVRCNQLHGRYNVVNPEFQNLRMFILGMGFVGQFFAADLKEKGWMVAGSCRSTAKKKHLEQMGYDAYVFNTNEPPLEIIDTMRDHTHLLVSIPPLVDLGDPMLQHKELLKNRLKDGNLRWIGYLSSTRVYGDSGGAWVDEDYQIMPTNELARARLAAEEGWSRLGRDLEIAVQTFRLGGIYGPGRSAIDTIIKQEPLSGSQQSRSSRRYTSRIHVSDICQALHASIVKPSNGRIYNIVDNDPAPRAEVFAFAQKLVKGKWLEDGQEWASSQMAESSPEGGYSEEKRVCNSRMKSELGVKLLYPTYRSGLQHIIHQMADPYVQNPSGS